TADGRRPGGAGEGVPARRGAASPVCRTRAYALGPARFSRKSHGGDARGDACAGRPPARACRRTAEETPDGGPRRPFRPIRFPRPLEGDRRGRGGEAKGPLHHGRRAPPGSPLGPLAGPGTPRGVRGPTRGGRGGPSGGP